ncbi:phage tail assembly protein [Serratia fonticola]|uniref:phage tail assembly protein n=1 Tax=Serratia fonticola TaxID=47917 RepID=UPI00301DE86A
MLDEQTIPGQDLPDNETITLLKPVFLGADSKISYETIELKEPTLDQVDIFYRERDKNNVLSGMGLLISLVSGVPLPAVKRIGFRDYKKCEVWLTRFLTWTPEKKNGEESPQT